MKWRAGAGLLLVLIIFFWWRHERLLPENRITGYTEAGNIYYPAQNWDMATRESFAFTSFGSRILPYRWFLALEHADGKRMLRDDEVLTGLGFIAAPASKMNLDALPIGFSRDLDDADPREWLGLTCAACHTGQIQVNGKDVRLEGGQALIDYTAFEQALLASLQLTATDTARYNRFIGRLGMAASDTEQLRHELQQLISFLERRYAINAVEVPYGAGRLDAFGQIFNAIAVDALQLPENTRAPDAPTSFPVLWDASHMDVVQWNGSAPNMEPGPLFQNATTALAVYGKVSVDVHERFYSSSIRLDNLGRIQAQLYQLASPLWPKFAAGELDAERAGRGEALYQQHCQECHTLVDRRKANRQIKAVLTPLDEIGTDRRMAENFVNARVKTGPLEGKKQWLLVGSKMPEETATLDVVMHVSAGALMKMPWQTLKAIWQEFAFNALPPGHDNRVYKGRPLNGIWSSAPYLHNGSVPTLYDLLLPPQERPVAFYLGNREMDVFRVGLKTDSGSFLFDTRLPGNSNSGHEFGIELAHGDRLALLEYLKSL
jgi:hypothetical protein